MDSSTVAMFPHQRVSVISPLVNITKNESTTYCLILYTYTAQDILFPEGMGTINIYQQFGTFLKRMLMVIKGTDAEENKWVKSYVDIPKSSTAFSLLIEAEFGKTFYSDMGLDKVNISAGSCPVSRPGNPYTNLC